MAPGVGPPPAAEPEVPVAEPVARYARDLPSRGACGRSGSRCARSSGCRSRGGSAARASRRASGSWADWSARAGRSPRPAAPDEGLGLGYGTRRAGAGGGRLRGALRARRGRARPGPTPARLGRPRARRPGRGVRRGDRRLRRRRRGRRGDPRRGGPRRDRARGGPVHDPRHLSRRPGRGALRAVPRRRPDDRRGPPAVPIPGRPRGRRDHGDQLGHLLPRPGARAGALAPASTGSSGRPTSRPSTPRPRAVRVKPVDPERMGRNGQLHGQGAEALGVQRRAAARNAGRCVQCSSCPRAAASTPSAACTSPTCRAPSPPGARAAGDRGRRILFEGSRAVGVRCRATATTAAARSGPARGPCAPAARSAPELLHALGRRSNGGGRAQPPHPPRLRGSGRGSTRRCAAGTASCRATTSTSGSTAGCCSRPPSRRSRSGPSGCPAWGASTRSGCSPTTASRRPASTSATARRAGRARRRRLAAAHLPPHRDEAATLTYGIARAAEIFFAAGATEVYPQVSGRPVIRPGRSRTSRPPRPAPASCGSGVPPDGHGAMGADPSRGVTIPTDAVHGAGGCSSPTPACCRPRSA